MGLIDSQPTPVELSAETLIRPADLARAIVKAIYNKKTEDLKGMDCIVGKLVQTSILKDPPRESPGIPLGSEEDKWLWLPFALEQEDRKLMESLLIHLPPLAYPMEDQAISQFRNAYWALQARPSWIPILITAGEIAKRLQERDGLFETHVRRIREEIKNGTLEAFDGLRVPTSIYSIETSILFRSAIDYVKRCGLTPKAIASSIDDGEGVKEVKKKGIYTESGVHVTCKKKGERYSLDELVAIKKFVSELNPDTGKKVNTQRTAAELIGVTESRITQLLTELSKRQKLGEKHHGSELSLVVKSNFPTKKGKEKL